MESPSTWTESHSHLVAENAPTVAKVTGAELARAWDAISQSVHPDAPRRRPSRRLVVGAVLTAAGLTVGGVAAATALSAHTNQYAVDAQDARLGGPGERLNPAASDFGDVLATTIADIPFPNDSARAAVQGNLVAEHSDDNGESVRVSTGALRAWAAQGAVCAWADQWAGATATGDAATGTRAAGMLHDASAWPAVTDVDPVQKAHTSKLRAKDARTGKVITGTADDSTQFAFLKAVQGAADRSSVGAMDAALAEIHCYGVNTPHLPLTDANNR